MSSAGWARDRLSLASYAGFFTSTPPTAEQALPTALLDR
jgi:hypothetical protein